MHNDVDQVNKHQQRKQQQAAASNKVSKSKPVIEVSATSLRFRSHNCSKKIAYGLHISAINLNSTIIKFFSSILSTFARVQIHYASKQTTQKPSYRTRSATQQ